MEGKKEGPEKPDRTQLVAMMGKCLQQQETLLQRQAEDRQTVEQNREEILQRQTRDKEEILQRQAQDKQDIMHRFDSLVPRLDILEKQAAQDREETQKQHAATQRQLQKQGKQCEIMQATLQQSLTALLKVMKPSF